MGVEDGEVVVELLGQGLVEKNVVTTQGEEVEDAQEKEGKGTGNYGQNDAISDHGGEFK